MASLSVEQQVVELREVRFLLQTERRSLKGTVANLKEQVKNSLVTRRELARALRSVRRFEKQIRRLEAEKLAFIKYIRELEQFLKVETDGHDTNK